MLHLLASKTSTDGQQQANEGQPEKVSKDMEWQCPQYCYAAAAAAAAGQTSASTHSYIAAMQEMHCPVALQLLRFMAIPRHARQELTQRAWKVDGMHNSNVQHAHTSMREKVLGETYNAIPCVHTETAAAAWQE